MANMSNDIALIANMVNDKFLYITLITQACERGFNKATRPSEFQSWNYDISFYIHR
jgi:hypothetical protein